MPDETPRFSRVMGQALYARYIDLKRTASDLDPAGDGLLCSLWDRQSDDAKAAWDGLWVGLVRNGWNGRLDRPTESERRVIHTIPVYEGTTPYESWEWIVRMNGEPINVPVIGWANVETITNASGETATVVHPAEVEQGSDDAR